ncbi:MAG: hypothetical protein WCI03_01025, partial [bacterium]
GCHLRDSTCAPHIYIVFNFLGKTVLRFLLARPACNAMPARNASRSDAGGRSIAGRALRRHKSQNIYCFLRELCGLLFKIFPGLA